MTLAQRLFAWNQGYDRIASEWRFQFVLWPILVLGAFNLMLTFWVGFPFALLLLLGILFVAAVRVPYALGWVSQPEHTTGGDPAAAAFQIEGLHWVVDVNRRYDTMPETKRFWVVPTVLVIAGAVNMLLTIGDGFPFGLVFLLALLALVAIRAPYTAGWFKADPANGPIMGVAQQTAELEHSPIQAIESHPTVDAPFGTPEARHAELD